MKKKETKKKTTRKENKGRVIFIDEAQEQRDKDETTFQDTYRYLESHGWTRLTRLEYDSEKRFNKYQTARVGVNGFFRLKKSNDDINFKQFYIPKPKSKMPTKDDVLAREYAMNKERKITIDLR